MPHDKLDQLDVDLATSLGSFVATPDAEGYEARLGQLLVQREELVAINGSPKKVSGVGFRPPSAGTPARANGFSTEVAREGSLVERCRADRRHRQEALTSAPLPCVPRPLHERLWQQVEAYRSPVSGKQLQDELRAFMRSRLSSLRVMHGQCVRHFTTLAAQPETDLSPIIFDAFQAQASWYESAIEKASAACIRLERTRTQVSSQAARSPVSPPVRSPLASPSMSRWDFKEPLSEESEEAFAEDLREMLKYRTYEQACGRRARQLLKRLEWLPISDGRRLAEEVHRKLTAQRERKGVERSQGSEGLPRQPVTLEEVEASLGVLASEFGYEADGVPSDPQIDGRGSADSESLEAQGTQLAMRVKDSFPDIFEAQEKRARLEPYPVAFLGAMIGEEQPVEQPEEFERDAFYLVRQDGGLAAETHRAGGLSTNNSFLDVSHSAASDVTPMPAQLLLPFAKESAKKSKDVSPEDELLRSVMAPPGWAHMPGHMAWLKSVKDVDTALRAEIEFLGASSRDDVSARLQELARLHSRQVATAGVDQMKQQFLQSAKVAAAAQKVREDTEAPKPPKPLQIQEVGRERSATLGSPKSPKKGDRSRPTSGRARAETPPNKPPAKAPGRRTSKDVSGSRPMTPAESTVAESVEETVAEGVKVTVPSRKLETLYILQLLKSRRLKLRLLHSVNVLHSVQKRLAEDFRRECRPEAEKAAEVQTEMRKLVDRFMKSESPVPSPPEWEDLPVAFRPGRSPGLNLDQGVTSSGHNTRTGGRNSSAVQQREGGETHRSDASRRYSAVSSGSDADEGDVGRRPVRRSEVERSKRPSNGQSSKLEAGSTGKGEQVDDDSSQGFKSSEWDDMFEFDPVVGCRVVKDGRGVRVVYSEALARFEDLMVEIQKIATGAIFKGMEQVEAVPADSAEDRRAFDRRAVLLEFLELETKHMSAKLDLVLSLFASYQHALSSPDGAARLRAEILGVIALRPSFAPDSVGQSGSFRQVYEDETAVLTQNVQIVRSVQQAQIEREKQIMALSLGEGHEESSAVGLPCPISNTSALAGGTPFPSVAVVGDVIKAVRATVEQLSWRLEMDDCASARRVLRTLVLRQTSELWETLAEEPRIRKGLVPGYEPPSFVSSSQPEHLKESLIMDNPTSLDAIVTSSLTGAGSPSLSEQDQFDRVCMTPTALSPDPKGRFPVTHLSLPGNEAFGGRARAATEPHFAGFGVPDTSPERSRPSSASVSGPRPPLSALARSGSTVHDSLAVNTSQGAFSSNNVAASATSYHGEAAPAAAADGAARALEVQRLRVALVRKLEESEILEGVYKAQALALGVAVDGTSLEPLLIQDGMGVAGKPARVLRDLEGETRMPPEDVDPKTDATIRGPKPAAAELDLDLLELDFHTPAGVQALLTSADGASRLRLAVQAQLAHSSALAAAVRSNGILLAGILRCVHHKSRSLLRDNESEVAMAQMGPPPTTEGWGDFEATLEAKQQLLRSPSRGWKEKPPAGLRPDQEIEVTDYRERITEELADLFLSVNKVKNQVRIGVLDSYTRKLQQAMQKKGVGANLRKAKADLKAELIEEYVKSVFQELAPFCRASELAEQMERLGKLLLTVSQTGEAHPGSFVLHGALTSGSHPFFSSPAILKQAALDFQDIHDWSGSGLVGAGLQAEAGGGQGVFPPPKGPLLMACPTPKYAKKAEDFGKRDPVLEGHRRFGLYLLDDAGKLAHIWACYSPLEALRLAAVRGLGVSEIGEGVEAVGAVADILRIRWATISLALPKVESPASGGGQVKLTGAIAAAAREQALAAAQKCRSIFWGETSALKEETEHVRMKSGGRAAVSLLQLKRTIAYWRHVLVLQASRDQLTKAGKEGAAREAARLLRLSAVLSERPGQEERLPRHVGAFLRAVREDALGSVCPSMDDGSFVGVKGTAAFELPRPASRTAARPQTAREVKPSHPKVDTWLLGALLPARALSLGALTEEERKSIVVEDKKLEHALDTALGDDRGYASTMPTRVNTKVAYHLELRLVHTHMKSAFLDGEAAISDAREGRKRTSESPVNGRQSLDLTPQNSRPPLTTNSYQEWVRLRLPGWFQSYPGLTSAEHVARAELFQKLVVRPLGDVTFAAAKALESAKDGGARLIVRPPATATKEISSMEAEVWKMKHLIDRHNLEATTLSLELHHASLLRSNGRRERSQHEGLFDPHTESAAFVEELVTLGVFTQDGPGLRGIAAVREDEEDGGKEWKVREATRAFVERLGSQAKRQQEIVQAALYARAQELSRSLVALQENRALTDWERQRERRQNTALREAEICDRGLGMALELEFLRRKLVRMDAHVEDYAARARADAEADCAEKVARLEKEVAAQKSNMEALRQDMNNEMLQAFADIKNETVLKIMSYQREDGHAAASAGVSPQIRMLQLEAQLQEQRAENADLRASVTKISALSKLRLMALSSKFRASLRAVRKERSVVDLEGWEARERAQGDGRALKEQLTATRAALAKSEEELRRGTKELAHVKRTKSKLLSWKVQNSRALDTLEQHDSRVARHVEAKQVAKLERLYTMASAFGEKQPGVEELETEVDRLEQKLAKEKALRRRAEERLQAREEEESRMEAERDSSRPPLENGHAKPAPSGTRGSSPLRSSRLGPPGVAIDSTEGQASKNSSTESSVRQRTSASNGPVPEKDETEGTVSSQPSYGQTVSISRPELELRSPAVPEPRAGTAPAGNQKPSGDALQWTFASSSLTKGATLQYLNSSRPQSAYDAKLGTQGLPKGRSVLLSDRAQRPSTGKKLPKGQL